MGQTYGRYPMQRTDHAQGTRVVIEGVALSNLAAACPPCVLSVRTFVFGRPTAGSPQFALVVTAPAPRRPSAAGRRRRPPRRAWRRPGGVQPPRRGRRCGERLEDPGACGVQCACPLASTCSYDGPFRSAPRRTAPKRRRVEALPRSHVFEELVTSIGTGASRVGAAHRLAP